MGDVPILYQPASLVALGTIFLKVVLLGSQPAAMTPIKQEQQGFTDEPTFPRRIHRLERLPSPDIPEISRSSHRERRRLDYAFCEVSVFGLANPSIEEIHVAFGEKNIVLVHQIPHDSFGHPFIRSTLIRFKNLEAVNQVVNRRHFRVGGVIATCLLARLAHFHFERFLGERTVAVSGIREDDDVENLLGFLSIYGDMEKAMVDYERRTRRLRGLALVVYKTEEGAGKAALDPAKIFAGHQIFCEMATGILWSSLGNYPHDPSLVARRGFLGVSHIAASACRPGFNQLAMRVRCRRMGFGTSAAGVGGGPSFLGTMQDQRNLAAASPSAAANGFQCAATADPLAASRSLDMVCMGIQGVRGNQVAASSAPRDFGAHGLGIQGASGYQAAASGAPCNSAVHGLGMQGGRGNQVPASSSPGIASVNGLGSHGDGGNQASRNAAPRDADLVQTTEPGFPGDKKMKQRVARRHRRKTGTKAGIERR